MEALCKKEVDNETQETTGLMRDDEPTQEDAEVQIKIEAVWTQEESFNLGQFEDDELDTRSTVFNLKLLKSEARDDQYSCKSCYMKSTGSSSASLICFATECCDSCRLENELQEVEYDPFHIDATPIKQLDPLQVPLNSSFHVKTEPVDYEVADVKPNICTIPTVPTTSLQPEVASIQPRTHSDSTQRFIQHNGELVEIKPCYVNLGPNLHLPAQCFRRNQNFFKSSPPKSSKLTNQDPIKVKIYICSNCGVKSTDLSQYKLHTAKCGQNSSSKNSSKTKKTVHFPCSMCSYKFRIKQNLINHENQHEFNEGQECNICNSVCPSLDDLFSHVRKYHPTMKNSAIFACKSCAYFSKRIHHVKEHNIKHLVDRHLYCTKCRRNYENEKEFSRHLKTMHKSLFNGKTSNRKTLADKVNKRQRKLSNGNPLLSSLAENTKETMPTKPIQSEEKSSSVAKRSQADQSIECEADTKIHKNKVTPKSSVKKLYKCAKCNYTCSELKSFISHDINKHDDDKEIFTCKLCQEKIEKCDSYIEHLKKVHPGNEVYACPYCQFSSIRKDSFLSHLSKVHKAKHCPVCSYTTQYIHLLKFHMNHHDSVIRPYSCSHCPYSTKVPDNLTNHRLKYHPNKNRTVKLPVFNNPLKRFTCTKCPYRTNRSCDLKRHRETHARHEKNKTPYQYKCRIRISIKENPVNESRPSQAVDTVPTKTSKTKENNKCRRYICSKCKFESAWLNTLYNHLKRVHQTSGGIRNRLVLKNEPESTSDKPQSGENKVSENCKLYSCTKCSYKSQFSGNVHRHLLAIHRKKGRIVGNNISKYEYPDSIMRKNTKDKESLQKKKEELFFCTLCEFKSCRIKSVYHHLRKQHSTVGGIRNAMITKNKPTKSIVQAEGNTRKNCPVVITCEHCSFKTVSKTKLKKHCYRIHKLGINTKIEENKSSERKLKGKSLLHSCSDCDFRTERWDTLAQHVSNTHSKTIQVPNTTKKLDHFLYQCSKCNHASKNMRTAYNHHYKVHKIRGGIRNKMVLKYPIKNNCTQKKNQEEQLKVVSEKKNTHKTKLSEKQNIIHKIDKLVKCAKCNIQSQSKLAQKLHVKIGHDNFWKRNFSCKYCGVRFRGRPGCLRHEQKHENKNLICDICGIYKTYRKDMLDHHMSRCKALSEDIEEVPAEADEQVPAEADEEVDLNCSQCEHKAQDMTDFTMHVASHFLEEIGIKDD